MEMLIIATFCIAFGSQTNVIGSLKHFLREAYGKQLLTRHLIISF